MKQQHDEQDEELSLYSYDINSKLGPQYWSKIDMKAISNQCNGTFQSGINIPIHVQSDKMGIVQSPPQAKQQEQCDVYYNPKILFNNGNCSMSDEHIVFRINEHVVTIQMLPQPQEQLHRTRYGRNRKRGNDKFCTPPSIAIQHHQQQGKQKNQSNVSLNMNDTVNNNNYYNYYDFEQLHIHIGSDHTIQQKEYDIEIHMVHRLRPIQIKKNNKKNNEREQQLQSPPTMLVIGILLDATDDDDIKHQQTTAQSNILDTFIKGWYQIQDRTIQKCRTSKPTTTITRTKITSSSVPSTKKSKNHSDIRTLKQQQRRPQNHFVHDSNNKNVVSTMFHPYKQLLMPVSRSTISTSSSLSKSRNQNDNSKYNNRDGENENKQNEQDALPPYFYMYHGSLTTPPCTENVQWLITTTAATAVATTAVVNQTNNNSNVSPLLVLQKQQYESLKQLIYNSINPSTCLHSTMYNNSKNNNSKMIGYQTVRRPLQPLNNRTISIYCPITTTTNTSSTTVVTNQSNILSFVPPVSRSVIILFSINIVIVVIFIIFVLRRINGYYWNYYNPYKYRKV